MSPFDTVQLPQGAIRYRSHGSGRPVLFVHGLFVDGQLWTPLLSWLGPGVRAILPDWPLGAHVQAMRPDADLSVPGMARLIADFIEALDLKDLILVGNDTGGALSQMVCARFPERIAALVLTTCDAYDVFPPPAFAYLKWFGVVPGAAWVGAQLLHHVPMLRRLPMTFGDLSDRPLSGHLVEHWLRPMRTSAGVRRDVKAFTRTLSTRYTEEAGFSLRGFGKPVWLLWSTRCRHFPKRLAERFQAELPQARLQWLDSRGLFLSLDHPQQVGQAIGRLTAELGGGTESNVKGGAIAV